MSCLFTFMFKLAMLGLRIIFRSTWCFDAKLGQCSHQPKFMHRAFNSYLVRYSLFCCCVHFVYYQQQQKNTEYFKEEEDKCKSFWGQEVHPKQVQEKPYKREQNCWLHGKPPWIYVIYVLPWVLTIGSLLTAKVIFVGSIRTATSYIMCYLSSWPCWYAPIYHIFNLLT